MQFVNTRSLDNQKKEKLNRKQNMRYLSVNKKPAARSYEDLKVSGTEYKGKSLQNKTKINEIAREVIKRKNRLK